MDPCPFIRILIGDLSIKFPVALKPSFSGVHPSTSPCFCKIKLKNFPVQFATIPLVPQVSRTSSCSSSSCSVPTPDANSQSLAASFNLNKTHIDGFAGKPLVLKISVYTGRRGSTCGFNAAKLVGKVSVPLDLKKAESRPFFFQNGWVDMGDNNSSTNKGSSSQLHLCVRAEPDPRFVFQFDGEPECSPQVFQVQGNVKQPVFTCKFGFRSSSDLKNSSMSEPSTSRNWLPSLKTNKDNYSKERKGWSITIHDLSGSPVAVASMVTPFVASPGSDRVSRSNPGAWLILRPGEGTWKPWGRLEAWRERCGSDSVGYKFELLSDTSTPAATLASSAVNANSGGKFTIDVTSSISPANSPNSSCDFGSGSRPGSRSGSGSGSDFGFALPCHMSYRGFVMSSTVEGLGKRSRPEVEVGVQHVTCTEDAAAFVAVAAAMDLSMDACRLFSKKLPKELTQLRQ
ncbi:hypothetical protein CsatB_005989 [Cannabis sativa]|uniref:Formin-like protein 18 n=2 Tax=Cannabis sativa TaxID=3483 RepID=A0A7J6GL52_CANSA|nr:uncharacterized protein LOC115719968 [Cannabis sativa]XP_060962589.1 uncharacterized protein LOC133032592 [Cannabis sativa]KAF4382009.1 hypothetical protein G4B88_006641 [Cannabis sativa]KAF4383635.1 hypothetical protein F8388_014135 [Cannabis sativa]